MGGTAGADPAGGWCAGVGPPGAVAARSSGPGLVMLPGVQMRATCARGRGGGVMRDEME